MKVFIGVGKVCVCVILFFLIRFFISCTSNERFKEVIVEIESVLMSEVSVNLSEGESKTLMLTITPSDATDKTIAWSSSDDGVATVRNGVVQGISPGTATITAKVSNGKSATCIVTVIRKVVELEGVELDRDKLTLVTGTSSMLIATIKPAGATDQPVVWESDYVEVATVKDNGEVTAVSVGTAKITAKVGGFSAVCIVTVTAQQIPATQVVLNKTFLSLTEGLEERLEATVLPENTTDRVVWSSENPQIAMVNEYGMVTAIGLGITNIVAKVGEKSAACAVEVIPLSEDDVVNITLNKITLNLVINGFEALHATVYAADADKYTVKWESNNTQVAVVDNEGMVTAVGVGTATITASAGSKSVTCVVTVSPLYVRVTSVAVEPSTHTMEIGGEIQLSAAVYPANAISQGILWYSKDIHKATVDMETGIVKAVAAGRVAIVAMAEEDEDIMDSCVIVINAAYIPVENVRLDKTEVTLVESGTETIYAAITPSTATNQTILWSSDQPDIAVIDENGVITAISAGVTTVWAEADGKSASCRVTVEEQEGQTVYFTDPVFEAFLVSRFDYDQNGVISTTEIAHVTELNCQSQNITSLDGLEYFRSLEILDCQNNHIMAVDLNQNRSLKSINCRNNEIGVLDISMLEKLEKLVCDENNLNEINVRNNVLLTDLSCAFNQLTTLDVSNNPELFDLNCSANQLTTIDISYNQKLVSFMCSRNNLNGQGLDISRNEALNILYCASCGLTELNLGNNPKLSVLICDHNHLSALDVSGNDRISILFCHDNHISGNLDISMLKRIDRFDCTSNEIERLFINPEVQTQLDGREIKVFGYDSDVNVEIR
jgi:uncharacterized protein YjdB